MLYAIYIYIYIYTSSVRQVVPPDRPPSCRSSLHALYYTTLYHSIYIYIYIYTHNIISYALSYTILSILHFPPHLLTSRSWTRPDLDDFPEFGFVIIIYV